jgi:hypothetical protein
MEVKESQFEATLGKKVYETPISTNIKLVVVVHTYYTSYTGSKKQGRSRARQDQA